MPLIRTSKWPLRVIGCKLVLFMICEISHGQSIKGPSYVTENSNHTFSCDYSTCSVSAITCTYSWNSSLITLPTDTSSKHITLTSIRREWNNAIINCNINVNGSSHVTAATTLNVQYGPLAANIPVKSPYTVTEGNTTSIACQAPACNPTCTAKWFNGSTQILSTTLFGEPVRRHFAGFYTCHVSNSVGNRTSQLHLIVNYVPILLGHNRTYNVSKGCPLTVTIPVSACPAVFRKDIKIGDRFVNDNIIVNLTNGIDVQQCIASAIQTLSVVINATQEEHFRNFTVNFTNAVDTTTTHFAIFPQGPPDVPLRFDEKSTTYHSVTFVVESGFFNGGEQTFVLQYRRVNSDSLWENGSIAYVGKEKNVEVAMTVDDLSPVTDYEFRVYAFNEYAQSKYSTVVQITTALHVGMVVGSVIGGVAGIVLIVLVVYFVCLKQKHDKKPPPIVPFTNILGALEEEKRQGHPQSNMYTQSSTESENVYMNTNTTKVTPLTVDDEEQYVNKVGVAPDRQTSVDSEGYLKVKDHSNDEDNYMNVAKQLAESQNISEDMSADNRVYENTQLTHRTINSQLEQGDINITLTKNPRKIPSLARSAKRISSDDEEDYLQMDSQIKPANNINVNTQPTPGKTKPNRTKGDEVEDYCGVMAMGKRNSTPKFQAPAPPLKGTDEEDYENTFAKRKKKSS